ncbi:restriction endonuclease subunit S [Aliarcobacter butzleri]|uniref:restriction endonuclease subunit S n=1 Tax=Aliarcobacter butzleri TaxID=28197 RepID=UPI0012609156|nr:restriction endonuclease subunit S [Aliarcobacter butzleri]
MSSWKSYKLGDIAEITSSKRIFYSEYVPSGIPFWRSKEIIEKFNRKNISTDLFISNEKYQEIKSKFGVPQQNDILLTSVGTLGIPYLVQSDEQFYFKDGNLTWIKNINNELLNPLFLFKWLASSIGRESLSEITIGSTQEALTISGLKTLELLLPPLEEQKAIAEVLSSLDDKIDLLHRQNQTLESLAQTLFRQWFIEEAKEEWEVRTFGDLVEVSSGKSLKRELFDDMGKYEVLGANGKIGKTNEWLFEEELIYTGRVGTLGNIFLIDEAKKVWLSDNTLVVKPKKYFYFIYFLMIDFQLENLNVGSTQPLVRQSDLKNIEISLPNDEIVLIFEQQSKDIFKKINQNKKQIQTLENLRDTLLPKLLSGEIKIKD